MLALLFPWKILIHTDIAGYSKDESPLPDVVHVPCHGSNYITLFLKSFIIYICQTINMYSIVCLEYTTIHTAILIYFRKLFIDTDLRLLKINENATFVFSISFQNGLDN